MKKNTWRHLWEIPNANYYFCGIPLLYWPTAFKKMGAGNHISKMLVIMKKGCFEGFYDPAEFSDANQYIFNKMKYDHRWVINSLKKIIRYNLKWIKTSKVFLRTDFKNLSDQRLVNLANKFFEANKNAHVSGLPLTYNVDAEEVVTKYLTDYLDKKIVQQKLKLRAIEIFSIFAAPLKEGNIIKEKKDSFKIGLIIQRSRGAKKIFRKETEYILNHLNKTEPKIKLAILKHYKKWRWLTYNYDGPALNLNYFLDIWRSLIKQGTSFQRELIKIEKNRKNLICQKKELYQKLKVDKLHKFLLRSAEQIVYLKGFRKDVSYFAYYCQERFWQELGRRLGLTIKQCRQILAWEIEDTILKKKYNLKELDQRWKFSLMYVDRKIKSKYKIYLGGEAKKFLAKQKFEKIETRGVTEIHGSCAETGRAKGLAKIINAKEDMHKMKKDDILIAANTSPDLLPAMKKAAAIVTDQGGITCHAAIVSRELGIPCVIGTKIATKVLKDGDKIEVDATKGIINIIKWTR